MTKDEAIQEICEVAMKHAISVEIDQSGDPWVITVKVQPPLVYKPPSGGASLEGLVAGYEVMRDLGR